MTLIQLLGDIEGYITLSKDIDIPIDISISDIRDISKKNGTTSRSVMVAGNKENNKLLNNLFDVKITSTDVTFDVNRKQECLIIQNGEVILDNAYLQLVSAETTSSNANNDTLVDYTILIKDSVSDFFADISNAYLTDIDISDLDHVLTSGNIIDSFDNTIEDGYKYPLPYTVGSIYNVNDFRMAIYAKLYMDRIFATAGKSYEWDGLEAARFDKLLIPYNGNGSDLTKALAEQYKVVLEDTQTIPAPEPHNVNVVLSPTQISDPESIYNEGLNVLDPPFNVRTPNSYTYRYEIDLTITLTNNDALNVRPTLDAAFTPFITVGLDDVRVRGRGFFPLASSMTQGHRFINEGTTLVIDGGVAILPANTFPPGETEIIKTTAVIEILATPVLTTDPIRASFRMGANLLPSGAVTWQTFGGALADVDMDIDIDYRCTIHPTEGVMGSGYPVYANDYIPNKIAQSEFIKSVFTMYNLFPVVDEDNTNNLILKSRDEYYDSGRVRDWNSKISKDQTKKITFLPDITSKRHTLTYKEAKDAYNTTYLSAVNEIYGQVEYTFDNEFIKNTEKSELIFEPSPFLVTAFAAKTMAISGAAPKTGLRILQDGGTFTCGGFTIEDYEDVSSTSSLYPFCSHFDNPIQPTFDINFGVCDYYFDNTFGLPTANNLGNIYWRRTMAQINSGLMVTAYFTLDESDIRDLRLNDKIYLNGKYWNINKVSGYNANKNIATKVELLSADDALLLPQYEIPVEEGGGGGVIRPGLRAETVQEIYNSNSVDQSDGSNLIRGVGNKIGKLVKDSIILTNNKTIEQSGLHVNNIYINSLMTLPSYDEADLPDPSEKLFAVVGVITSSDNLPIYSDGTDWISLIDGTVITAS